VVWEGWSRKAPPYPDLWRKAVIRDASLDRPDNSILSAPRADSGAKSTAYFIW
jgi:hypothetical protein